MTTAINGHAAQRTVAVVIWASVLTLAGCADSASTAPRPSPSTSPSAATVDCGIDDGHPSGRGYNATARTCLWENYQSAHPAKLLTSVYGVEGSRVEYELSVPGSGGVDVLRKLRGDMTRFHCLNIQRQDNTWGYRLGLLLTQCATVDFVAVP